MATDHENLKLWDLVNRVGLRVGCGKTVRCHTMYEQWSLQEVFAILGCCNKTTVHLGLCMMFVILQSSSHGQKFGEIPLQP